MAVFLGVNRSTLYLWAEKYPEFSDILEQAMARQAQALIENGLTGAFNSTITKLMLTKHGYTDRQDVTTAGKELPAISGFTFARNGDNSTDDQAHS